MDIESVYQRELERLKETLERIEQQLANIGPRYYGDDFVEQVLDAKREETRHRLELLGAEPYFGRLDFKEKGLDRPAPLYIGKRGMDREDTGEPYIIDWRAPVASLFYSFIGGDDPVEYEAPDGLVEGEVYLKRNLAIRDQTLQRVVDSYVRGEDNLGITDEFLLYRLGENKDNRLRDIVSTIQAEQDRIIRENRQSALIIQGAAGSGKTTVALHRLAFLLYQYREQLRAERMIIFAPNAMFLDYISGVLPELGVGNIQQTTFTDWALELLEHQVKLADEREGMSHWFSAANERPPINDETPGRFKGSLAFKQWIEHGIRLYEANLLTEQDFTPWKGSCLPERTIREWFEVDYQSYPLAARRERLAARIKRWLEMELSSLSDPVIKKERSKSARQRLRAYLKKIPVPDSVAFYKLLFGLPKPPQWIDPGEIPRSILEQTRRTLKRGLVQIEDLAPLLWIRKTFHGTSNQQFDHVVIDEAQDSSPFQLALLNGYMREPSFTILGDLAQGIYEFRGISRWEELSEVFQPEHLSFHQLRQSYRSTTEIIEFANTILEHAGTGLPPAQPVFRSGEPVSVVLVRQMKERIRYIGKFIKESQENGMRTVSIIGRNGEECRKLHEDLTGAGIETVLIEEGMVQYRGGVSVVPVHLAKGLEFDAVLVADVDANRYTLTPLDAKLLYVSCTRALHRLDLIYFGEISPLLKSPDIPTNTYS